MLSSLRQVEFYLISFTFEAFFVVVVVLIIFQCNNGWNVSSSGIFTSCITRQNIDYYLKLDHLEQLMFMSSLGIAAVHFLWISFEGLLYK